MFFNNNMWPYGKLQYILHQLNLDWLVKQVKQNTDDIEDIREHGSGSCPDITAAATVDSSTGTPSVNVVKTGTDEEPPFTFNFHKITTTFALCRIKNICRETIPTDTILTNN